MCKFGKSGSSYGPVRVNDIALREALQADASAFGQGKTSYRFCLTSTDCLLPTSDQKPSSSLALRTGLLRFDARGAA